MTMSTSLLLEANKPLFPRHSHCHFQLKCNKFLLPPPHRIRMPLLRNVFATSSSTTTHNTKPHTSVLKPLSLQQQHPLISSSSTSNSNLKSPLEVLATTIWNTLRKPAVAALFFALLFIYHPNTALAASGGRMGGRYFPKSSSSDSVPTPKLHSSSSSSSSPRSYSAPTPSSSSRSYSAPEPSYSSSSSSSSRTRSYSVPSSSSSSSSRSYSVPAPSSPSPSSSSSSRTYSVPKPSSSSPSPSSTRSYSVPTRNLELSYSDPYHRPWRSRHKGVKLRPAVEVAAVKEEVGAVKEEVGVVVEEGGAGFSFFLILVLGGFLGFVLASYFLSSLIVDTVPTAAAAAGKTTLLKLQV